MKKKVVVNDKRQKNYVYYRTKPIGKSFHKEFKPELTPKQMLKVGVFEGRYFADSVKETMKEFPKEWFKGVKFDVKGDKEINFFKIKASKPLNYWREKGWIKRQDPRGWVQWYFRYYSGRRSDDDERQISRWKAMKRHIAQLKKHCRKGDFKCRPKQRQALLHWAYDSRKF
jgi:hypothetical protein